MTGDGAQVYDERNLVILSRYEILEYHLYRHYYAPAPHYMIVTTERTEEEEQEKITVTWENWERPILHASISVDDWVLDVINLHMKSRLPSDIEGKKLDQYTWNTASGWAEGGCLTTCWF